MDCRGQRAQVRERRPARISAPRPWHVPSCPRAQLRALHGRRRGWKKVAPERPLLIQVVVEVFSGAGGITRALKTQGRFCLAWDLEYGNAYDLSVPSRRQLLLGWLAAGLISALWIATPCQTFTRARDNPPGPPPLRSDKHILGLPGLSLNDALAVKSSNLLMRFSALLFSRAIDLDVPVVLENPLRSRLWLAPPFVGLRAHALTTFDVTEFCGWQRLRFQKSTGFLGYGVDLSQVSAHRCHAAGRALCDHSGHLHQPLRGKTPQGTWWTKVAEPYPARLCIVLAIALDSAIAQRRSRSLHLFGVGSTMAGGAS